MKSSPAFVYRAFNSGGSLLYVGVTTMPQARMTAHAAKSPWFRAASSITLDGPHERKFAAFVEGMAILIEKPLHNKNGRRCATLPSLDLVEHNDQQHARAMNRAAELAGMRNSGLTWAEIGSALNISRQRAQQIASRLPE